MDGRAPRWMFVAFVAFVAAVAIHVGVVVHHEPYAFDAWNVAYDTRNAPFSWSAWLDYNAYEYLHGNPRIGQAFAYLGYKVPWTTEILTPAAWLALIFAIATLGLGRLPSGRNRTDLAITTLVLGIAWLVLPYVGTIVFCRSYASNYLYSAAAQLWFVTAYRRLDARWVREPRPWQTVLFGIAGALAGAGNEHTGPLLFVIAAGVPAYLWWRRRERWPLLWAGAIGVCVGYAWLFFAPGHDVHYDGLAGEAGLSQRALSRGIAQNAVILRDYLVYAAPVTATMLLILLGRRGDDERLVVARRAIVAAFGAGLVIAVTLFVSPKLGHRFFFLPMALLLAALVQLITACQPAARTRTILAVIGVLASLYVAFATIALYRRLHRSSDVRLAELAAVAPGELAVVTPWEIVDLHWFFWGDDFKDPRKRRLVQDHLGTGPIVWFGPNRAAPLGLLGAGFRVELEPAGLDEAGIQPTVWETTIPLLVRQLEYTVRHARERPAGLTAASLRVRLPAMPAGLPDVPLLVARWSGGAVTSYMVGLSYRGASGERRSAEIPAGLAGATWYPRPMGLPARRLSTSGGNVELERAPGRTHWLIACLPEHCFVTAVVR